MDIKLFFMVSFYKKNLKDSEFKNCLNIIIKKFDSTKETIVNLLFDYYWNKTNRRLISRICFLEELPKLFNFNLPDNNIVLSKEKINSFYSNNDAFEKVYDILGNPNQIDNSVPPYFITYFLLLNGEYTQLKFISMTFLITFIIYMNQLFLKNL